MRPWNHDHDFHLQSSHGEQRTLYVVILTALTMVVEIGAGHLFGSIALLADGWPMATHVAALGITLFAYRYARRHANNPYYSFGTGKVGSLGGFAGAVALAAVALMMGAEATERLLSPEPIHFDGGRRAGKRSASRRIGHSKVHSLTTSSAAQSGGYRPAFTDR